MLHKIAVFADYDRSGNKSAPAEGKGKTDGEAEHDEENRRHGDEGIAEKILDHRAEFAESFAEKILDENRETGRGELAVVFGLIFGCDSVGGCASGADSAGYDSAKESHQKRHPIAEAAKAVFRLLFDSCACPHKKHLPDGFIIMRFYGNWINKL